MTDEINTNFDIDPYDDDLKLGGISPVAVRITGTSIESLAPDFGSCSLFIVPVLGTAIPPQILQRRPRRNQAYVYNYDPVNDVIIAETPGKLANAQSYQGYIVPAGKEIKLTTQEAYWCVASAGGSNESVTSVAKQGSVTDPGASGVIAAIQGTSLVSGAYTVTGSIYTDGTVQAGDEDNYKLVANGVAVSNLNAPAVADQVSSFGPFTITFTGAPTNISIEAIAAASNAAAVYHASLIATPVPFIPPQNGNSVLVGIRDESWISKS